MENNATEFHVHGWQCISSCMDSIFPFEKLLAISLSPKISEISQIIVQGKTLLVLLFQAIDLK